VLALGLISREARPEAALPGEGAGESADLARVIRIPARTGASAARPAAGALLGHQLLEVALYLQALLREQFARHLIREAVGVVQPEHLRRGNRLATRLARLFDVQTERRQALGQGAPEALLLRGEPRLNRRALLPQLRVGAAHELCDPL